MNRMSWLLVVPLGLLASTSIPAGCVELESFRCAGTCPDDGTQNAGGGGSGGGMATSSSTGGVQCMGTDITPCTPLENACRSNSKCVDSQCTWDLQNTGTQVGDDLTYGDCKNMQCDATGEIIKGEKPDDVYDFGNPCYKNNCSQGATLEPEAVNTQCKLPSGAKGVCDGNFHCVQCNNDTPCPSPTMCNALGFCVDAQCANNTKDANETDVDCGGSGSPCPACAGGKTCVGATDCETLVCDMNKKCAMPTCTDEMQNGDETDQDCGGSCATGPDMKKCGKTLKCLVPGDCQTGICIAGACQ